VGAFNSLTVNGVPVTGGGGGGVSPSNVPAFMVHRNGVDQSIPTSTNTQLIWTHETLDTYNNFAANRFTPSIAGIYIFHLQIMCETASSSENACLSYILKNGATVGSTLIRRGAWHSSAPVSVIIPMNGTTDYVEAFALDEGTPSVIGGGPNETYFSGSLLASGNGLISGSTALADRISSSNNLGAAVATTGGTISFTLGGTAGAAYLHPTLGLVASGVSTTGTISATSAYFSGVVNISPSAIGRALNIHQRTDDEDGALGIINSARINAAKLWMNGNDFVLQAGAVSNQLVLKSVANGGNVGVLKFNPTTALDISGTLRIANGGEACTAGLAGAIRYSGGGLSFCNGTAWTTLGSAGAADWYSLTNIPAQVQAISNSTQITMQRISTTYISASVAQFMPANDGCTASLLGSVRRSSATGALQLCR
jgi:hypothetical protein